MTRFSYEIKGMVSALIIWSIIVLWLLNNVVGLPLIVGMVQYEKYGQDPLKRGFIDKASILLAVEITNKLINC